MCQVRPFASMYPWSGPTNQRRASGTFANTRLNASMIRSPPLCRCRLGVPHPSYTSLSSLNASMIRSPPFVAIKPSDEENPLGVGIVQVPVLGHSRCRDGNDLGIIQREPIEGACLFQDVARRSGD